MNTEHHNKPSGLNTSAIYSGIVSIMIVLGIINYILERNGIYPEDIGRGILGILYGIWWLLKRPIIIGGGLLILWWLIKFIKAAWED